MRFTLEFDCDNAAFDLEMGDTNAAEITDILRQVADRIDHELPLTGRPIRDSNGNTIGKWELS